ncbi:hypothetical protein AMTR_s00105p00140220 [Amborella trichopoda]|uniref:Uncharacterized protein n=1 Tax=Amborella trichopoda TaxID=13333 RepID=W1NXL0_AMBTC|nr:hypothetical protein AMTR_s00105p00140220 [Amborella trichopoda]
MGATEEISWQSTYLMPPIRQEIDNLQPNEQAFQTAMYPTTLIFDDIVEPYMPERVCWQFGVKQGIPRNPLVVEEYKTWYNLVSHLLIHNVANPPKDILQPHIHEEEEVVPAHEPQYIMRRRGYEDQLVSVVKASTVMLVEAFTLRQKWYPEVLNRVNDTFEMLSKFVPVDMGDVEARMEHLQCQYND